MPTLGRFTLNCFFLAPVFSYKQKWVCECESRSVVSDSLQPFGLYTVHGILQARILGWVAVPFSRGSSQPRDQTQVSHIAGGLFTSWAIKKAAAAKSLQSCPTLCDPIDGSPPGSPSLGFSRQEYWSGLPFPSPVQQSEKWKWSRSVLSDS